MALFQTLTVFQKIIRHPIQLRKYLKTAFKIKRNSFLPERLEISHVSHALDLLYRSSYWKCFCKKVFLTVSHGTLLKKRFWHRCFPLNSEKFFRTPFFTEQIWTTVSVYYGKKLFFLLNKLILKHIHVPYI